VRLERWGQSLLREAQHVDLPCANGRVGKTQICRRLRSETFDESVPSTHDIQVSSLPLATHVLDARVTLKIWNFGGQGIYHGTHALFLKSRAVFPVVWTPTVGTAGAS